MSWYRTGRVAVTNGSKTVTGVGTLFTTAVNVGDAFALVDANLNPTGAWYEVEAVVSNTEITLKQSYAGTTGSNKQYCVFNLVGNMTTPSFAQRLATFFASFQSLIDKPTATPTALGIPVADANGDIDSGWIPATFFNKTNILGTVSQVGGVPTGAIIERGSNANGEYVKFADGTMICTGLTTKSGISSSEFVNLHYTTLTVDLPATFTNIPSVTCEPSFYESYIFWTAVYSWLTTRFSAYLLSERAFSSIDMVVRFIAIGRWF